MLYPLYWRLGGHQGRSRLVQNSSSLPEFDSRTLQPVAILYTDCPIFNLAFLMEIQSFLAILHKFLHNIIIGFLEAFKLRS